MDVDMPLNEQIINEASERYHRERDRYRKLTQVIYDICQADIIEKNAIPAQVTSRTKSIGSFTNKLIRFSGDTSKAKRFGSVEDVFRELSDFSGVRIALYSKKDQDFVRTAIEERFRGPEGKNSISIDEKDKNTKDEYNFYRAIHCQVHLAENDIVGENANLDGLSCEIQICTMMAHVWNEIEHDLVYKTKKAPNNEELQLIKELGLIIRRGDETIDNLFAANEKKIEEYFDATDNAATVIQSESELTEFLARHFNIGRVTFRSNIGFLFDQLWTLNFRTVGDLKKLFANADWRSAKSEINRFNRYMNKVGETRFHLSPTNSADPALWILLEKQHKEILKKFPAGRGQGRPRLIRSLASRFERYKNSSAS